MAKVTYMLSPKVVQDMAEVRIRFYHGRKDVQCHTGIKVPAAMWSDKEQRLVISRRYAGRDTLMLTQLEAQLEALRSLVYDRWLQEGDAAVISKAWLQAVVDEHNGVERREEVLVSEVVTGYCDANNLGTGTRRQYKVLRGMLERFGQAVRPLGINDTTAKDLADFAVFLRSEGISHPGEISRSQNTINSKLRRLAAIFRWLLEQGRIGGTPFDRYKVPEDVYGTPIFLTIEERDRLAAYPFARACDCEQRDVFVFQCHVGCRVSDLMALTCANVVGDMLQYIQHKLRKTNADVVRVPLSHTALEIIERYKGLPGGMLLPCITDVKYNVAIKRLLKAAGIDRMVIVQDKRTYEPKSVPIYEVASSHMARRTFMANMYKLVRSERIVSAFSGHAAGSAAFKRYTDVDDEMKREIIEEMERQAGGAPE